MGPRRSNIIIVSFYPSSLRGRCVPPSLPVYLCGTKEMCRLTQPRPESQPLNTSLFLKQGQSVHSFSHRSSFIPHFYVHVIFPRAGRSRSDVVQFLFSFGTGKTKRTDTSIRSSSSICCSPLSFPFPLSPKTPNSFHAS